MTFEDLTRKLQNNLPPIIWWTLAFLINLVVFMLYLILPKKYGDILIDKTPI